MSQTTLTADDLKKLPLRAIVAFAARCARRVAPLAALPEGHPEKQATDAAIADGLGLAEDFARGRPCPTLEDAVRAIEARQDAAQGEIVREDAFAAVARAIHSAAIAAHAIAEAQEPPDKRLVTGGPPVQRLAHVSEVSADLAALNAYTAARDAAEAQRSTDDVTAWAAEDFRKLLELGLGHYPDAGEPIDPSPGGPLGPLHVDAGGP